MHAAEAALVATGALALVATNAATVLVAGSAAVLMAWRTRERGLTCSRPSDTLALRKRPFFFVFFWPAGQLRLCWPWVTHPL